MVGYVNIVFLVMDKTTKIPNLLKVYMRIVFMVPGNYISSLAKCGRLPFTQN